VTKSKSASPTQRSLQFARTQGWEAGVVERRNPGTFVTHDLFNFADIVVIDDQPGILFVQATSTANVSARQKKLDGIPTVRLALERGNRVEVWGWSKRKVKRGGKAVRWTIRRIAAEMAPGGVFWGELD